LFSIDLRKKYQSKETIYSIYINKHKGPCFGNALFWVNNNCFIEGGFMNDGFNMNYDNQKKEMKLIKEKIYLEFQKLRYMKLFYNNNIIYFNFNYLKAY